MKLLVLGATGGTGQEVVASALARGHEVTVLVRDPSRIVAHDRLRAVFGDALDPAAIEAAVPGHDAVLSVLGTRARFGEVRLYSSAIRLLLDAMRRHDVGRLVALSAAGVPDPRTVAVPWMFRAFVIPLLAGPEYRDMARMESAIAQSATDWTVVRPLWLRKGESRGRVRIDDAPFVTRGWGLRRADLATAMIDIAENDSWPRSAVWIGY